LGEAARERVSQALVRVDDEVERSAVARLVVGDKGLADPAAPVRSFVAPGRSSCGCSHGTKLTGNSTTLP
jgi:hypothetical protein